MAFDDGDPPAVDADIVARRVGLRAKLAHGYTIHRDAPVQHQALGCAPGRDAGLGQDLLQTFQRVANVNLGTAVMRPLIIAIDGPSGAGKGTVARAVARELGYRHIDSGAMYRAVGWKALGVGQELDEDVVVGLAQHSAIELTPVHVTIDGEDVTRAIRTPEIDRAAAAVARIPKVRAALVARQRSLGQDGAIVMEGRDIGTVVFPDADVKIYLDASPEERARRRASDPAHTGGPAAVSEVVTLLAERDEIDRTRAASPLYAASDAHVIDTTGKSIDEVVREVLDVVNQSLSR